MSAPTDPPPGIPENHFGTIYTEVMRQLSHKRSTRRYLEIGVNEGFLLQHIVAETAVGVDPQFSLNKNPMPNKKRLFLYQVPSDAFFETETTATFGGPFDLAFLDGLHTFEFLLRDFFNAERMCAAGSLIALHDCLPLNAEMADRNFRRSLESGRNTSFPGYWTGDVWKIIPILKRYRPDLRLVFVDAPPSGLVFVTNLDPASTVLKAGYLDIVAAFRDVPNSREEIEALYADITLVGTSEILNEEDHTLFFRI